MVYLSDLQHIDDDCLDAVALPFYLRHQLGHFVPIELVGDLSVNVKHLGGVVSSQQELRRRLLRRNLRCFSFDLNVVIVVCVDDLTIGMVEEE